MRPQVAERISLLFSLWITILQFVSDGYGPLLSQHRNQSQDKDLLTQTAGGVGTGGHLSLNMPSGSLSQANFLDLSQIDFSQDNDSSEVSTSMKVDLLSQDSAYIGGSVAFASSQINI